MRGARRPGSDRATAANPPWHAVPRLRRSTRKQGRRGCRRCVEKSFSRPADLRDECAGSRRSDAVLRSGLCACRAASGNRAATNRRLVGGEGSVYPSDQGSATRQLSSLKPRRASGANRLEGRLRLDWGAFPLRAIAVRIGLPIGLARRRVAASPRIVVARAAHRRGTEDDLAPFQSSQRSQFPLPVSNFLDQIRNPEDRCKREGYEDSNAEISPLKSEEQHRHARPPV